MEEAAADP